MITFTLLKPFTHKIVSDIAINRTENPLLCRIDGFTVDGACALNPPLWWSFCVKVVTDKKSYFSFFIMRWWFSQPTFTIHMDLAPVIIISIFIYSVIWKILYYDAPYFIIIRCLYVLPRATNSKWLSFFFFLIEHTVGMKQLMIWL